MKVLKIPNICALLSSLALLSACQINQLEAELEPTPVIQSKPEPAVLNEQPQVPATPDYILRARILADMLYEASLAFEDGRLLFPADDNAYDRYLEVLSVEPDNAVALQGVEGIVGRYVSMAIRAIEVGQFADAEEYLFRAASIRPEAPTIAESRAFLENERAFKRDYFALDPEALSEQSLEIMSQLGSIGEYVKNQDATFLITARNDAEARWIYQIMREAVGGYRLRGNIAYGNQPTIQVNNPNPED
jgi:hypothetical protein